MCPTFRGRFFTIKRDILKSEIKKIKFNEIITKSINTTLDYFSNIPFFKGHISILSLLDKIIFLIISNDPFF